MDRLASMETFIRVVETGSFSGAARQLRVGQPAVSKTVAQLETYLGVKLLTRSTRGLTPTEAGLGYFERAKRAIEEAEEAELAARGAGTGLKGRLRVCAAVTFARIHLVPLLPQSRSVEGFLSPLRPTPRIAKSPLSVGMRTPSARRTPAVEWMSAD